jgi:hypothetical protein
MPPGHDQAVCDAWNRSAAPSQPETQSRVAHAIETAPLPRCFGVVQRFTLLVWALIKHAAAAKQKISPWQALSIQEQAIRTADLCGLREEISNDSRACIRMLGCRRGTCGQSVFGRAISMW